MCEEAGVSLSFPLRPGPFPQSLKLLRIVSTHSLKPGSEERRATNGALRVFGAKSWVYSRARVAPQRSTDKVLSIHTQPNQARPTPPGYQRHDTRGQARPIPTSLLRLLSCRPKTPRLRRTSSGLHAAQSISPTTPTTSSANRSQPRRPPSSHSLLSRSCARN